MAKIKLSPKELYTLDIPEDDVLYELKLPKISTFGSRSKKHHHCPYIKFQKYVVQQMESQLKVDASPEGDLIDSISQIVVSKKTAEKLNQETIDWLKNLGQRYATEFEYGMLHLDIAPSVGGSPNIKDGMVYIRKGI